MRKSLTILLAVLVIPGMMLAGPQKVLKKKVLRIMHQPKLEERLKLSDEQKEQQRKIKIDYQKKRIPLQASLKLARIDLKELMRDDAPQTKIYKSVDKVHGISGKLFKLRIRQRMEMRKVLTTEQKKLMKEHAYPKKCMRFKGHRSPMMHEECEIGSFREGDCSFSGFGFEDFEEEIEVKIVDD